MHEFHLVSHVTYQNLRPDLSEQLVETALVDPTVLISFTPPGEEKDLGWQPYYETKEALQAMDTMLHEVNTIHATRIAEITPIFTEPEFPVPPQFAGQAIEKAATNPKQVITLVWQNGADSDKVTISPHQRRKLLGQEGVEILTMLAQTADNIIIATPPPQAA